MAYVPGALAFRNVFSGLLRHSAWLRIYSKPKDTGHLAEGIKSLHAFGIADLTGRESTRMFLPSAKAVMETKVLLGILNLQANLFGLVTEVCAT